MTGTPKIPELVEPVLIDAALLEIQMLLVDKLEWLDHAFGKAKQLKEVRADKSLVVFPSVYIGQQDYFKVFPDEGIGNFTFFDIEDGETFKQIGRKNADLRTKFGLIVWFDFRNVYPDDWQNKSVENVKAELLTVIRSNPLKSSTIKINRILDRADNVYRGYTHKEIDYQFYMRPFGGFRIEGEINYLEKVKC